MKKIKGVVNWLENDEKARKGVTKVEKSKQGEKEFISVKKGQNRPKGG